MKKKKGNWIANRPAKRAEEADLATGKNKEVETAVGSQSKLCHD